MQPHKLSSELQEKILKHVCFTTDADYKTISKYTDRDRITILQSLKPLIAHKYVAQIRLDPERPKSKVVFKPTDKGILYSIAHLGVNVDAIRKAQLSSDALKNYSEFIQEVPDPGLHEKLEQYVAPKLFVDNDLFDENGKLIISEQKDFLKQGLRISLLELLADKHFNLEELFEFKKGYLVVIEALHPTQVKILRDVFVKIRNNLNTSLNQLSNLMSSISPSTFLDS
jgi:hypothetical protein